MREGSASPFNARQRRRDLCDRITRLAPKVCEYAEGTELACEYAIGWCAQISRDVEELEGLLKERFDAIRGSDRVRGARQ